MSYDLSALVSMNAPQSRALPKSVRRGTERICGSKGVKALYNTMHGTVHFYLDSPWFGVASEPADTEWSDSTVFGVMRHIALAGRPKAAKDIEVARADREREYQAEQNGLRYDETVENDVRDIARHHIAKGQMGKHWKGRAVVSGTRSNG